METEVFYPANTSAWKKWLVKNHLAKKSVWVLFYSKSSGKPSISWRDAVDLALCYGWIDSKKIKIDSETSHQFFSKRKPNSTWSKINKEKVSVLIDKGLMAKAGMDVIKLAKQNGSWSILDEVEDLVIPPDLETAFRKYKGSKKYFQGLSRSTKKMMLTWIVLARRPETRNKRIVEIVELAAKQRKPRQF